MYKNPKRILFFTIMTFVFKVYSVELYEDEFIKLNYTEGDLRIEKRSHLVVRNEGKHYLQLQYSFYFEEDILNVMFAFLLKDTAILDQLLVKINNLEIKDDTSPYGMGDVLKYANETGFTLLNKKVKRYAQDWPSAFTRDICIYLIDHKNEYYDEVLVEILNVWPRAIKIPYILNNKDIDQMIKGKNNNVIRYEILDEIFEEGFILKDFLNFETVYK